MWRGKSSEICIRTICRVFLPIAGDMNRVQGAISVGEPGQSPREVDLMNEQWKCLVILDACRFDYFASIYPSYLRGDLKPIRSRGSCTPEFLLKTFKDYYDDVVYISANPYSNSKVPKAGFDAKKHFFRVVDVWRFGWNVDVGTVPPDKVNEAVISWFRRRPEKRFIVHYLQPHAPYLESPHSQRFLLPQPTETSSNLAWNASSRLDWMMRKFEMCTSYAGLDILGLEVRRIVGLPPAGPIDATRRKFGLAGLREAYSSNLRTVLLNVRNLFLSLNCPIVVTADHGEFLGDGGRFGHPCSSDSPIVRNVPWLEVSGAAT